MVQSAPMKIEEDQVMKNKTREIAMPASAAKPTHHLKMPVAKKLGPRARLPSARVVGPIVEKPTLKPEVRLKLHLVGDKVSKSAIRSGVLAPLVGLVVGGFVGGNYRFATITKVVILDVDLKDS